jgi:cohesin complex subunit SCC1
LKRNNIDLYVCYLQVDAADAEELEEKRWTRRTQQMMHVINKHLNVQPTASFKEMTIRNNRKQVASKFYTLLVLKKMQAIEVEQSEPYGDIAIVHGPKVGLVF